MHTLTYSLTPSHTYTLTPSLTLSHPHTLTPSHTFRRSTYVVYRCSTPRVHRCSLPSPRSLNQCTKSPHCLPLHTQTQTLHRFTLTLLLPALLVIVAFFYTLYTARKFLRMQRARHVEAGASAEKIASTRGVKLPMQLFIQSLVRPEVRRCRFVHSVPVCVHVFVYSVPVCSVPVCVIEGGTG